VVANGFKLEFGLFAFRQILSHEPQGVIDSVAPIHGLLDCVVDDVYRTEHTNKRLMVETANFSQVVGSNR